MGESRALAFEGDSGAWVEGLACYARAEFFEAHEQWEKLWRQSEGQEKILLLGLIQLAVALCHHQRGNRAGARSLFAKSIHNLERCSEEYAGIAVARLRREACGWLTYLDAEVPGTPPSLGGSRGIHAPEILLSEKRL
jgi:hypothetical protein